MTSIVEELQQAACNPKISVSDLLNKALVVASKLNLPEPEIWIRGELGGYFDNDEVEMPRYRIVCGIPKGMNEFGNWKWILANDSKVHEIISKTPICQPIAELEQWAQRKGDINLMLSPGVASVYQELGFPVKSVLLSFDKSVIVGVLEKVRRRVLDWALELEKQGIVGEELSFSEKEKAAAARLSRNTYNISAGGSVQIQNDSPHASQSSSVNTLDIDALRELMREIKSMVDSTELDETKKGEIKAEVATVLSQTDSPNPKKPIIAEAVKSIRRILESTVSSAAVDFLKRLGEFLPPQ